MDGWMEGWKDGKSEREIKKSRAESFLVRNIYLGSRVAVGWSVGRLDVFFFRVRGLTAWVGR